MAGVASAFCHGGMGGAPQHAPAIGAVGIVTGGALFRIHGIALVLGPQFLHVVALDAQLFHGHEQALGERPRVGGMAGQTVTGCCWGMGMLGRDLLRDGRVAVQAEYDGFRTQQMALLGLMGGMAFTAGTLKDRLVAPAILGRGWHFVAFEADATHGLPQ